MTWWMSSGERFRLRLSAYSERAMWAIRPVTYLIIAVTAIKLGWFS